MTHIKVKQYLLSKPESFEDYPFGPDIAVFKIEGKMFATLGVRQEQHQMNLKCDPLEATQLRDIYPAVQPGYHMNKTHWNTLILDNSLPMGEIERQIDLSYALVVKTLKIVQRRRLELKYGTEMLYSDAFT